MPDFEEFRAALAGCYAAVGSVSDAEAEALFEHYRLLLRWNRVLNLTRIEAVADAVERHYCESLFLADRLPPDAASVLDVGSGAGFPGIPMAIRRPRLRVTLAESHLRKSVFLREATRKLANVRVAAGRAEQIPGDFEWVVSRAVRWEDVVAIPSRSVALLLGADDAVHAAADTRLRWQPATPLPWGKRKVLLVGYRVQTSST